MISTFESCMIIQSSKREIKNKCVVGKKKGSEKKVCVEKRVLSTRKEVKR